MRADGLSPARRERGGKDHSSGDGDGGLGDGAEVVQPEQSGWWSCTRMYAGTRGACAM